MSRRSDPARIDKAREAATRNRLIGTGLTEATADSWIAAWEAQAAQDGLPRDGAVRPSRLDRALAAWTAVPIRAASTRPAALGLLVCSMPTIGSCDGRHPGPTRVRAWTMRRA